MLLHVHDELMKSLPHIWDTKFKVKPIAY